MEDGDEKIFNYSDHQVGFRLPEPVIEKIDSMIENVLEAGGGRTSRREIIGMLIAFASSDVELLEQQLRSYRRATVNDLYPDQKQSPKK